jgi:tRNA wybutosine-synthesizing protein 3
METFDDESSIFMKTVTSGFLDPDYVEEDDLFPEKVMNMGDEFLPRAGHSATVIGDTIYIFGGADSDNKVYDNLLSFDIEEKEIKKIQPKGIIPKPRASHAACSDILQTKVYIQGGADASGNIYNDLLSYIPKKNRFERIETTGDVPPPLYGHSLVPYNHYLYLFGGTSGFVYFNDLYRLDLLTKIWTKLIPSGRSPEKRYKH